VSRRVLVLVAALAACRFGGSTGDPSAYVPAGDGGDAPDAATGDDATLAPVDDAGDDEAAAPDAGIDGDDADADRPDASATCAASGTPAVCDPVRNTGCVNAMQQCDIDTRQTTPTGICVFPTPSDAGPCSASIFTETCSAHFACVASVCRQPCYCDSDCASGSCCSDTSGPPGWRLCAPCP
jgi:hypothetical protein